MYINLSVKTKTKTKKTQNQNVQNQTKMQNQNQTKLFLEFLPLLCLTVPSHALKKLENLYLMS